MLSRLIVFFKAAAAYLRALVQPIEPVIGFSLNGHSILEGWELCPEEAVASWVDSKKAVVPAAVGFYCFAGPHETEFLCLGPGRKHLGPDSGNSLVLTPASETNLSDSRFLLVSDQNISLSSESAATFSLNGRQEVQSPLFDYDEIEVLGNKFLVFDLNPNLNLNMKR